MQSSPLPLNPVIPAEAENGNIVAAPRPLESIRVLVLTSGHDATDSRVYARQARSLRRLGAAVTLVAMITKSPPDDVFVIPARVPRSRLNRFLLQPWRCFWSARRETCDVVHFHDAEMLMILPFARLWWPKTVFIYDVHEDFANLMLIRSWIPKYLKPVVKVTVDTLEKLLVRLAHGVVGVTPPLTEKFSAVKTATAFNFVTKEFFEQCARVARAPAQREYDVVHLGTLNERRGQFLCEVLEYIQARRPQTRVLIIGISGQLKNALKARLPGNCTVLPYTGYKDLPALLGNSRVGIDVHPWADPHLKVALPVKLCEYMAAGCAVVCSSMPVLDSVLEGASATRYLDVLHGGSATDYAGTILRALSAIDAGSDPGATLRNVAREKLVWDKEMPKIVALYLDLLGSQPRYA